MQRFFGRTLIDGKEKEIGARFFEWRVLFFQCMSSTGMALIALPPVVAHGAAAQRQHIPRLCFQVRPIVGNLSLGGIENDETEAPFSAAPTNRAIEPFEEIAAFAGGNGE